MRLKSCDLSVFLRPASAAKLARILQCHSQRRSIERSRNAVSEPGQVPNLLIEAKDELDARDGRVRFRVLELPGKHLIVLPDTLAAFIENSY